MTPTTYGRDFAYCLKSHGGVRGFNASLWQFLLRCTLFCHSVATFLTSVSSYEGGCGFEEEKKDEKAVKAAVSPLVQQYLDLKKKHPDAILLFRCGDFYETYKDDAVKASKILGITLTKSNGRKDDEGKPLAMAGFPYHALDTYLPKLIRAGERVAICDQLEMPKQTTSSKRGITEMVSPGKETGKQMAQESQETEQHTSLRR